MATWIKATDPTQSAGSPTGMTPLALRNEVLTRLGEAAGFFTNANVDLWLQDGVNEVAIKVEPLLTSATHTIAASTAEYELPADIISIKRALYGGSGAWQGLSETTWESLFNEDPDFEDDEGTPNRWYWRVNTNGMGVFGTYPKKTAALAAGLRILYTHYPAAFTAGGTTLTTGIPPFLDRAVVCYAVHQCRLKDRDEARAAQAYGQYLSEVNQGIRKLQKHRKEHGPQFIPVESNYRQYYQRGGFRRVERIDTTT